MTKDKPFEVDILIEKNERNSINEIENCTTNEKVTFLPSKTGYNSMQAIAAGSVVIWKFVFLL
jgi:hypothetical protein